jgi:hypothetical protein
LSEAYDDDMAAEQAILDHFAREEQVLEDPQEQPRSIGGRPPKVDPIKLVAWRQGRNASIAETAKRWNVSEATVKRLSREYGKAAEAERQRYEQERLDEELEAHAYGLRTMFLGQRNRHLNWVDMKWFSAVEAARATPNEVAVIAAREAALEKAEREFREDWERCMGPLSELFGPH